MPAGIEIRAASITERPIVDRLLQLYLYDTSEFGGIGEGGDHVDEQGRFSYPWLDLYWNEEGREVLLHSVDGALSGLVLLNRWSPSGEPVDHAVAEFFVMRRYRRLGVGREVAHRILRALPGVWEIGVAERNAPALAFWRGTVADLGLTESEERSVDGERWSGTIFRLRIG